MPVENAFIPKLPLATQAYPWQVDEGAGRRQTAFVTSTVADDLAI
jgi:hypothetical protein